MIEIQMRIPTLLFLLVLVSCSQLLGQTPAPAPTPPAADETDVVKITTALIQLDVTVTDKKGKIVTDLGINEIEVYENGQKQDITNFSFVSHVRQAVERSSDKQVKPTVLPVGPIRRENIRRTIAVVVDDLSLSFESMYFARRALRNFVDEQMEDGDLIAIIRTGAGVGALQQFTSDKRQLHAAIERLRWNSRGAGRIGAFSPIEGRVATDIGGGISTPEGRNFQDANREYEALREDVFKTGTLGALSYVVRGMQELPGRKSMLVVSDGLKLFMTDEAGFKESGRVLGVMRNLIERANRAGVVIYTMDARGLVYTGPTAADDTRGMSVRQIAGIGASRGAELNESQDGLRYLALETGGLAALNSNDLSGSIQKILNDHSYYLVGYEPDSDTFDPRTRRFNKIEIKVTRPGVLVRYRSGFFGVTDEKVVPTDRSPQRQLLEALTSPFGTNEVALRLNGLFYDSKPAGPHLRALIHVRAGDLSFTDEPNGDKKTVFDLIAIGVGDNGVAVDQLSKTFTLTLKKEIYQQLLRSGFVYDFSFPTQKAGAIQLRVALRDHRSSKIGSASQFVEIPNLKKNRLVLSGAMLENVEFADWQRVSAGQPPRANPDPLTDTSLRQFKRGTVLNYGFAIYNAKLSAGVPNLSYQTRIFRDGELFFEGEKQRVVTDSAAQANFAAAISLGTEMKPGEYVLQVVITDNLAGSKHNTATQFVQFEIVE